MNHFINNLSIASIEFDQEDHGSTGEIYFNGGEYYCGEIKNQLPCGEGQFHLRDGSFFEGNFDENTFTEGSFKHFSGITYSGTFNRDRFYKGYLNFINGDSLSGEWGNLKGRWVLKTGVLKNEDKKVVFDFNKQSGYYRGKTHDIYADSEEHGFYIKI